jgi:hypothetical protein
MKKILILALAAAVAAWLAWNLRTGAPAPQAPPPGGPGAGAGTGSSGSAAGEAPVAPGLPPAGTHTGEPPPPEDEAAVALGAQKRRERLERLMVQARGWVRALQPTLDLSAAQVESMEREADGFASELEAIWWRQGEEFDREVAEAKLYEKWNERLGGHLSVLQREQFAGLPRDWGYSLTTPGPR